MLLRNELVYLLAQRLPIDSSYRICLSFELDCEFLVIRMPDKQVHSCPLVARCLLPMTGLKCIDVHGEVLMVGSL